MLQNSVGISLCISLEAIGNFDQRNDKTLHPFYKMSLAVLLIVDCKGSKLLAEGQVMRLLESPGEKC